MTEYSFVESPNLPETRVLHAVVSPQYGCVSEALIKNGIEPLFVTACESILEPVSLHADMLFSYLGGGRFVCEKSQQSLSKSLQSLGFINSGTVSLSQKYPHDVLLNNCLLGNNLICSENITPGIIKTGRNIINVKQGYAKCSCAVVDENSVITDDESIFSKLSKSGFDVLLVSKGSVKLHGFGYGFIGGCCGKIANDTLAFCGDITTHSDFLQIDAFLRERHVYPLSLFGGELIDIGSIIPVTEYKK